MSITSVSSDISKENASEGAIHVSIKKAFPPNGVGGVGGVGGMGVEPEGEVEQEEVVKADAVIVALPLSLMQQGAVEFDPPLREVRFFLLFFFDFAPRGVFDVSASV